MAHVSEAGPRPRSRPNSKTRLRVAGCAQRPFSARPTLSRASRHGELVNRIRAALEQSGASRHRLLTPRTPGHPFRSRCQAYRAIFNEADRLALSGVPTATSFGSEGRARADGADLVRVRAAQLRFAAVGRSSWRAVRSRPCASPRWQPRRPRVSTELDGPAAET